MKSSVLSNVLAVLIVILGYFVFISIKEPLKFREELQRRNKAVISKLNDIRTAEILFKQTNNHYTGSFDTLAEFIKKGKIPVVKIAAGAKDSTMSKAINYTIWYISISDSIFGKKNGYKLKDIASIPFSEGAKFFLAAGHIEIDGVSNAVFEASAPYKVYLLGIDNGFLSNIVQEENHKNRFPGLKVGSLNEATTAGNWE
jgi:hypothetical protein